jgi:hypothetical protein
MDSRQHMVIGFLFAVINTTADLAIASSTTFTDRAEWAAIAGTAVNIDFSTNDDRTPLSKLPYTYFRSLMLKGVFFTGVGIYMRPSSDKQISMIRSGDFAMVPDNTPWRIHLPVDTMSFGLDLAPFYNLPGTYTINLSTGEQLSAVVRSRPPEYDFFGVTSTVPIEWVEISLNTSYLAVDNFSFVALSPVTAVGIDVLPIAKESKALLDEEELPVAILASTTFSVAAVDVPTVRFGANGTEAVSRHWTFRDVDSDGRPDLVLQFRRRDAKIACNNTRVVLTGKTTNGRSFQGIDTISRARCLDTGTTQLKK